MYILALAADYDGTIAHHGFVDRETCKALRELKETGRRLLLVTGRELADLRRAFPEFALFDRVVAENGAVIYDPATGQEHAIAPPPPPVFVERLVEQHVEPISVGHSIVATWEPQQIAVLKTINELGLELQIIFNKGAVMVLPAGVSKASGLKAALAELDISPHNVVAVGDAENDHGFLQACGFAAAVANALPAISAEADIALAGDHGAGVVELVRRIMREDGSLIAHSRYAMPLGVDRSGQTVHLEPNSAVLIAGASGSGKSRFATLLSERMTEKRFEFCIIDPEGDYTGLQHAVHIGSASSRPTAERVFQFLYETGVNLVINTQSRSLAERQHLLAHLTPAFAALRARTGRPNWILVDEAHQLLPALNACRPDGLWAQLAGTVLVTAYPELLTAETILAMDVMLVFGSDASALIARLAADLGLPSASDAPPLASDEMMFWSPPSGQPPRVVKVDMPTQNLRRHTGKYAIGDVGEARSFYFRGPRNAMNLRARNLLQFLEIAQQVDDATWDHHLRAGDYSAWLRGVIRDEELAREVAEVERDPTLVPSESRRRIREVIGQRYLEPAHVS
jgi:HAD superfamily hydrolase (TIGR01484 family)